MAIVTRAFDYHVNGATFDGAVVLDEAQAGKRPAVMVFHGWEGRSDAQVEVARSLARLGYIGFACDLFGKGIRGQVTGDNSGLIAPFLQDRAMLRTRLVDTVRVVQTLPEVDPKRVAAIGFCFGGLCVLDLARSGLEIRAVASFHGLFGKADGLPTAPIKARVIAFHGWDDPMVPPSDVVALSTELTEVTATRCTVSWPRAPTGPRPVSSTTRARPGEHGSRSRRSWPKRSETQRTAAELDYAGSA